MDSVGQVVIVITAGQARLFWRNLEMPLEGTMVVKFAQSYRRRRSMNVPETCTHTNEDQHENRSRTTL